MLIRSRIQIQDYFPLLSLLQNSGIRYFRKFIRTSRTVMTFGEMTDADKIMNSQHFGRDPADILIRIQINPEIGMRIPD